MDAQSTKQAAALAELSRNDLARLERLAAKADVSIECIWGDVYLYGFDDVEESVQASIEADADIAGNRLIAHEEVMEKARQIVEAHVCRQRKTG